MQRVDLERPLVMGVVNVTPDSFSDGGAFLDPDRAVAHGLQLLRDGADLLDIGGEATNPRATPVDAQTELDRILPVIEPLAAAGAVVSVDTTKAEVARAAVRAGARIINDVSGGLFDPEMPITVAELPDVTYIAGHLRGTSIADVFANEGPVTWREVAAELGERLARLPASARSRVWVDPGLGFGKGSDPETNLALVRSVGDLGKSVGCPVLVGPSRKRFLAKLLDDDRTVAGARIRDRDARGIDRDTDEDGRRLALDGATVAVCLAAVRAGARVLRVHNVALLRAALAVYTKL